MNTENQTDPTDQTEDVAQDPPTAEEQGVDVAAAAEATEALPADEQIASLSAKLAEAEKRELLAAADMENFRKRTRQNTQDQLKYASMPIMNDVIESADNLKRAIEAAENDPEGGGLMQGVKMVSDQMVSILEKYGCQKIHTVGYPFDPNCHEAVQMQPSDEFPANVVMMEVRTGFMLHDRVVRTAQVFVSTGPA